MTRRPASPRRSICGSTTCAPPRPGQRITARATCYHVTRTRRLRARGGLRRRRATARWPPPPGPSPPGPATTAAPARRRCREAPRTGSGDQAAARHGARRSWSSGVPYIAWLGIEFERKGDELTATLPFADKLIGNPMLPAIHGGVTAAFLEATATIELAWSLLWDEIESGRIDAEAAHARDHAAAAEDHRFHRRLPAPGPAARRLCPRPRQPLGPALCQRAGRGLAGQPRRGCSPPRPGIS